jgi:hypothetical protein
VTVSMAEELVKAYSLASSHLTIALRPFRYRNSRILAQDVSCKNRYLCSGYSVYSVNQRYLDFNSRWTSSPCSLMQSWSATSSQCDPSDLAYSETLLGSKYLERSKMCAEGIVNIMTSDFAF